MKSPVANREAMAMAFRTAFADALGTTPDQITDATTYSEFPNWDSVAHMALIAAIEKGDEALAVRLMDEHLSHVESSLTLDRKVPSNDISMALT